MSSSLSARHLIETRVARRAEHSTKDDFQDTCSFAQAERLFGREYHGRYLVELLQNAADAWRLGLTPNEPTDACVIIESEPAALVVANRGPTFPAETVLESLGQIGRSSKRPGEAIGHKGIGFKSVLEVSNSPEIYSGLAGSVPELAVRFDADRALETIRAASPQWDEWIEADRDFAGQPLRAVPVLRYPSWVEQPPPVVRELAEQGFTTVVRLPFDGEPADLPTWLEKVRGSLTHASDQILVLLGCFNQVVLEDRGGDAAREVIRVEISQAHLKKGRSREDVRVSRNGAPSSNWVLYRMSATKVGDITNETAVGLRLSVDGGDVPVHAVTGAVAGASEAAASAPFHLFFPTKIGSGLPFLLHGYFEVDAGRTGFFGGSADRNNAILEQLADLTAAAVNHTAKQRSADLVGLVNL
ncbi:MAG TPA: hypothetical protein VFE45_15125, partial [Coriobacteriia bacterium]|nr:hypothetical protein [Coriobacteriia bacterium]